MADPADMAADREFILRQEGLARVAAARLTGPGRLHCEECDTPIPEARRKAVPGVRLCITCQKEKEQ